MEFDDSKNVAVTGRLAPGDRVIVEGQLKVRPGMRVNPQPYRAGN